MGNLALIAVNILVFVLSQGVGANEEFTYAFATVPKEIVTGEDQITPESQWNNRSPVNLFPCRAYSRQPPIVGTESGWLETPSPIWHTRRGRRGNSQ